MRKVDDKLAEWHTAAEQLMMRLPPDDPVFLHWCHMLDDFEQDVPQLHKLASEAMKVFAYHTKTNQTFNRSDSNLLSLYYFVMY